MDFGTSHRVTYGLSVYSCLAQDGDDVAKAQLQAQEAGPVRHRPH